MIALNYLMITLNMAIYVSHTFGLQIILQFVQRLRSRAC